MRPLIPRSASAAIAARLGSEPTERYSAPWDRSRRDRLAWIVRDAHKRDPLLAEPYLGPAQEPGRVGNGSPGLRPGKPD